MGSPPNHGGVKEGKRLVVVCVSDVLRVLGICLVLSVGWGDMGGERGCLFSRACLLILGTDE